MQTMSSKDENGKGRYVKGRMGTLLPLEFGKSLEPSKQQSEWEILTTLLSIMKIYMLEGFS